MLTSLLFYIAAFVLSGILLYIGSKKKLWFSTMLGLAIPVVVSALRNGVGADYSAYVWNFSRTDISFADFMNSNISDSVELTFWVISSIARMFGGDATAVFAIYSAITVVFFYLAIKGLRIKNPSLAMMLYLLMWFPISFSAMRQFAAISLVMFALQYLISGHFKKYALWVIVASLFHTTAVLFIPIYFLRKYIKSNTSLVEYNRYKTVVFAVMATAVSFFVFPLLIDLFAGLPSFEKYAYMSDEARSEIVVGGTFILQLAILSILFLAYRQLTKPSYPRAMLLLLYVLGVALYTFGFRVLFAYRFSLYLLPISALLISDLPGVVRTMLSRSGVSLRMTPYLAIGLFGIVYFFVAYYLSGRFDLFPYRFIWDTIPA